MTLFSWYKDNAKQDKVEQENTSNAQQHQLNQAMWPTAQVRDSLLASAKSPQSPPSATDTKSSFKSTALLTLKKS